MTSLCNMSAAAALIGLTMVPVQGFAKLTAPAYEATVNQVPSSSEIKVAPNCGSACGNHFFDIGDRARQQREIKVAPNCGTICGTHFFGPG